MHPQSTGTRQGQAAAGVVSSQSHAHRRGTSCRAGSDYAGRAGSDYAGRGSSRIIMPGEAQRSDQGSGRLIMPGTSREAPSRQNHTQQDSRPAPPQMPAGQGNFPELSQESMSAPAAPRNFRPPIGFMDEQGPKKSPFDGKTTDQILSTLTSRSDHWFNLALAFPRLYTEGFERSMLEDMINVSPARQEVWMIASNVYHTLQESGGLTKQQLDFYKNESFGPECLLELRFLDAERRQEGARYIADNALSPSDSVIAGRAVRERQRRADAAAGFSEAGGDCMAFKYMRDAEETRKKEERKSLLERALRSAVTEGARERLESMLEKADAAMPGPAQTAATLQITRLQKDEAGARVIPVAGSYPGASAQDVAAVPSLGASGPFQELTLPGTATKIITLPRWSVIALAKRPAVLWVSDVAAVPEISKNKQKAALRNRGHGMLVLDAEPGPVEPDSFYLQDKDGKLRLEEGKGLQGEVVARVLLVVMPPRPSDQTPKAID